MKRDGKPETSLPTGGPFVDPGVAARNPAAATYAKQIAERMGGSPRGGGPSVPIPPLNAPHQEGMTMSDQAMAHRQPPAPVMPQSSIFQQPGVPQGPSPDAGKGVLNTDVLPETARQDPLYREGHGSMYAVNQPALAAKYGVVRNGQFLPPQQIQTGRPGLSSQTIEGLKAVQELQGQRAAEASGDAAAERASAKGPAGDMAQIAGPGAGPVTPAERNAAEEALQKMDDFDFNSFREVMMKDLLNNDEQRTIIEERLQPLNLADLIINGRVYQTIPVRPGQYEPELQSMTGEDELALKRLLMDEKKNLAAPDRYLLDKYQLMTMACGIRSINRTVLGDYVDKDGFNDTMFWTKFNQVLRLPFHLLASVGVQYYWFDMRVRKLFAAERIKNG